MKKKMEDIFVTIWCWIVVKFVRHFYCAFQAKYKDPRTGIQYNNSMEFGSIRSLPMDIVSGYLALRKAAPT